MEQHGDMWKYNGGVDSGRQRVLKTLAVQAVVGSNPIPTAKQ